MDSRVEWLLEALLKGESIDNFEPRSRLEEYLKAVIEKSGVDGLRIPRNRFDALLYEMADKAPDNYTNAVQEGFDEGYLDFAWKFLGYYTKGGGNHKLKMSYIPKEITYLRGYTFCYSYLEETVILPEHITNMGNGVFAGAMTMKKAIIPDTYKGNTINLFREAVALEEVVFSKGVTYLYSGTFGFCTKLKRVTNLGNITSIGSNVFQGSTALEYVEFESLKVGTSVKLNYSNNLTVECLVGILNSLVDMTGVEGTHTLYLGSTNLAKLTDEQKAIATNKNVVLS